MAAVTGLLNWSLKRDDDGHRNYTVSHLVRSEYTDGPYNILQASGLPVPGSNWSFFDDFDSWAFCKYGAQVDPVISREKNRYWVVTNNFSTRPDAEGQGQNPDGQDPAEDPLSEPPVVSGTFVKYTREATADRFGIALLNSSYELFRGSVVEFDANRPSVHIEHNTLNLALGACTAMIDTVNDGAMWGLPVRCVKLSNFSWERKYHTGGLIYYVRKFDFDIDFATFDRDILDEGTKVLRGQWDTDENSITYGQYIVEAGMNEFDPHNYIRFKDFNGENARTLLNGFGVPLDGTVDLFFGGSGDSEPVYRHVEKYDESNFFSLGGIPAIL